MNTNKNALVAGASGINGRALVEHLSALDGWEVTGLARSTPDLDKAKFISVDLLDRADCERKLGLQDITHIFYAGYVPRPKPAEEVAPNLAMLVNLVEVIESTAPRLQHITLVTGGKFYGPHLGPCKTPAKESDPWHMPPNFYFDQEDFLRKHQRGKNWTWTNLRPSHVTGYAVGNPMNLIMAIAVYATISKELNRPLRFPGKPSAYTALTQICDTSQLAKAAAFVATSTCSNEAFNVANGDLVRWQNLWPSFAEFFRMDYAAPQSISLAEFMADKGPLWEEMVARYGLRSIAYDKLVAWSFSDFVFAMDWDMILDLNKIRRAGFHEYTDTEEMFLNRFSELRRNKVIP